MNHLMALSLAVCLDLIFGDPYWMPHPVRLMGFFIKRLEIFFRKTCHTQVKLRKAGVRILVLMIAIFGGGTFALFQALFWVGPWYAFAGEVLFSYWILSGGCLAKEARKVKNALSQSIYKARKQIAMLVGRDTQNLNPAEIICAAVETVAENTADGIISPLFFLMLGGPAAGMIFKAVSTMDSMLGYMNKIYRDIGRAGARADDVLNFLPARMTGVFLVCAAWLMRLDYKNAGRILKRDHANHKSPNCGWPEAAAAGAMRIRLGGTHMYFGESIEKPTIGDDLKRPEAEDIQASTGLLYAAYVIGFAVFAGAFAAVFFLAGWSL